MDRHPIRPGARNTPFSDEVYHQLFEKSLAVQLLIDPESGRILDANPAACHFYGYDRDTFTRLNVDDINTLTAAELAAEMQRAKKEERNFFRFRHCLSSGEERDVEVYSSPLEVGSRTLLHSIIIDVSQRVALEEHLKETKAVLGYLTAHVDRAAGEVMGGEVEVSRHKNLSEREYEVMVLLAVGKTTEEIANHLFVSRSTIRTYRGRVFKKMDFKNEADLVRYVTERRLLK